MGSKERHVTKLAFSGQTLFETTTVFRYQVKYYSFFFYIKEVNILVFSLLRSFSIIFLLRFSVYSTD